MFDVHVVERCFLCLEGSIKRSEWPLETITSFISVPCGKRVSSRLVSPIDGKSMESICSTKMFQKSEYKENGKIIRWTEV